MRRGAHGSLVALLLTTAIVPLVGCDENILDPMADRQPRAHAYKVSAFYDDGLAMRAGPEGTVPRERSRQGILLTEGHTLAAGPYSPNGEPVNGGFATTVPIPVNAKLLALGRKRFDIICSTCHGPTGDGDSIVARQMALRPPPSLHKYNEKPPGYLYEVITKGFGLMASYAAEMTIEERWAVVAYVRALQVSQNVPVESIPANERARLQALPEGASAPVRMRAPVHKESP